PTQVGAAATRDEQSRQRPRVRRGDGCGGVRRGAEAEVADVEGGPSRLQPRRQFLLPHQHRSSQRSASAQLTGGLSDGDARCPHGGLKCWVSKLRELRECWKGLGRR
ncbi:hypothetical protein ZEAMMB73_Zm00001d039976, partial [Zea mays]